MDMKKALANQATGTTAVPDGALMAFKSHIEGRNAMITVWPDRIEWTRNRMFGRSDTDTIMMRAVSGIRTHKSGLTYTEVEVAAGVSSVTMRVTKSQAAELRRIITQAQAG